MRSIEQACRTEDSRQLMMRQIRSQYSHHCDALIMNVDLPVATVNITLLIDAIAVLGIG